MFIDILATSHDIIYENKKARIVVINDITQRKKIELEVLRSEMKLKEAQQVAKLGNWELDLITDNLFWSEEVYSIFELDNNTFDASYDAFLNAIHPEDKDFVNKEFQKAIKSKKPYETEHRLLMPDGRIKYVIEKGFIDYNTKGNPIRSVGTVQDITERKMFELELQRNRMLLRSMIDSLPMWLAAVDPEGNYFIANQYYSKTFGIPLDQIENHNFREFFKPELYKKHKAILEKCVKSGKVAEVSDEVEFEKGQITHIYGAYTPLKDSDGKIFGVSAAVMDISKQKNIEEEIIKLNQTLEEKVNQRTLLLEKANRELMIEISERTRAEEFIKRQLAEKEVLLKEIHHRVKNNMQVIISILNLQLSTINDENISRILRDSQARIKTMALIHEKLYETKDFSNIDLLDYIKNLFEFLSSIYKSPSENIRYSISGDQVQVDIDSIIAVGLITNEIITNSYKYAFSDRKDGKIEIRLNRKDEKHLVYKIKDNGIGFPEGFDYRNAQSLGLQLVCILTEQIQGTLEVISSPKGTEFVIVFPSKL
ncbi:hypothetical protein SDC9_84303 [bioreactor metagenome]|uniref:Histidine kinase n=1 Tax=bioreactor metagenome TaxID=1076179 RepID=A0A644ZIR0_9ZZZZ